MKVTSTEFSTKASNQFGARYYIKILSEGIEISEVVENLSCEFMVNASRQFSIGNACSQTISFTITNPTNILTGKEITLLQGLKLDSGDIEYVQLGKFTVMKPSDNRGVYRYECVDRMVSKMETVYFSDLSYPTTDIAILQELCTQAGISLANADSLKSHQIKTAPQGYTKREIISYMAQLQGRNAIINSDGNLELIWYNEVDYTVTDDMIYLNGVDEINDETDYELGYLKCKVMSGDSYTTIQSGTGITGIIFENPFMTQEILDEVFSVIGGFSFRSAEFDFLGDFRLELGDVITVTTYGKSYKIPIMKLTHESDGGVITTVESIAETDVENEYDITGPKTKEMDRYYAELVLINEALVNKLSVEYLDVVSAEIKQAIITELSTEFLTVSEAQIKYADIKLANIDVADIGSFFANSGIVTDMSVVDGKVTGVLDSVTINANSITSGTLTTDRLVIRGSEKSLVYELNNITGALQSKDVDTLNGEIITPRTINADRLVANSITANEIDVADLVANTAFINAISTNSVVVGAVNNSNAALSSINGLKIGGRNLLPNSNFTKVAKNSIGIGTNIYPLIWGSFNSGIPNASTSYHAYVDSNTFGYNVIAFNESNGVRNWKAISMQFVTNLPDVYKEMLKSNDTYYLSMDVYQTQKGAKLYGGFYYDNGSQALNFYSGQFNIPTDEISVGYWKRVSVKVPYNNDAVGSSSFILYIYGYGFSSNAILYIKNVKLEKGNKATDWSPAPEDISVENIYTSGTTTINGGLITTGTITADKINVTDLFAQDITATGTITGATLIGSLFKSSKAYSEWDSTKTIEKKITEELTIDEASVNLDYTRKVYEHGTEVVWLDSFKVEKKLGISIDSFVFETRAYDTVDATSTYEKATAYITLNQSYDTIFDINSFELLISCTRGITIEGGSDLSLTHGIFLKNGVVIDESPQDARMGSFLVRGGSNFNGIIYANEKLEVSGANQYPLIVRCDTNNFSGIELVNTTGTLGYIAMNTKDGALYRINSTNTASYPILDSSNIGNYCVLKTGGTYIGSVSFSGGVEVYYTTPYIDFHFNNSSVDYTTRLIENSSGILSVIGGFTVSKNLSVTGSITTSSSLTASGSITTGGGLSVSQDISIASGKSLRSSGLFVLLAGGNNSYYTVVEYASRPVIRPNVNSSYSTQLGSTAYPFYAIFSQTTLQVSDKRLKDNIKDIDSRYLRLWDKLVPKTFNLKSREGSTQIGFIAQDVERSAYEVGLSMEECGFINKEYVVEDNYTGYSYNLSYTDLAVLTHAKVKSHDDRIKQLENDLKVAQATISTLQAQLMSK